MELSMRAVAVQQCRECAAALDSEQAHVNRTLVGLLGMPAGWRLCPCGLTAAGVVNGVLVVRDDFDSLVGWCDAEPVVTLCPPGAAADAMQWP